MNIMKKFTLILAMVMVVSSALVAQKQKKPNINKALKSMQEGNLADAKSEIDRASEYEKIKDNGKTWYYRGLIYAAIDTSSTEGGLAQNAVQTAMESFAKADEMGKEGSDYYITGDMGLPVTKTQQLDNLWAYYYNEGIKYINEENNPKALEVIRKCVVVKPEDMNSHYLTGLAHYRNENHDDAIKHFNKYLKIEKSMEDETAKDDGVTEDVYGKLVYIIGTLKEDKEGALVVLSDAKAKFPTNTMFPKQEIDYLIQLDKVDEAKTGILKAIEAEPNNATLYFSLGVMYENLDELDNARQAYEKAIEVDPNNYNSQFNLAVMVYNEAVAIIKKKNNLGISAADLKKADEMQKTIDVKLNEALPYWEKIHELEATEKTAVETLKYIYVQMKMMDKAEAMQTKLDALGDSGE